MADRKERHALICRVATEVMGWLRWDGEGDWIAPPGRELDTMFCDFNMNHGLAVYENGDDEPSFYFDPTSDMGDAWLVVGKMNSMPEHVDTWIELSHARDVFYLTARAGATEICLMALQAIASVTLSEYGRTDLQDNSTKGE